MNIKRGVKGDKVSDEQRFQLLVSAISDYAIYMLDTEGYINSWNTGAQRFKGYSTEEILGRHFSCFYTPQDNADGLPARALRRAAEEGKYEAEGWRVRKDGRRFWASVVIDPIRNDAGELIGFAKITRDITEKREAAEALQKANAALFQSQKMEALGQLTGGIAHDFNNLLSVVSSGIDLLSMQPQNKNESKILESIRRAVERGAGLTQHLLSFARQQPLQPEKHNLNDLIGSFESVLRRAGDAALTFDIRLGSRLKTVSIDATRFQTTLLNLVVNARDAMPAGGKLSITTENVRLQPQEIGVLASGDYVRIVVADTGTGMPPEVVARAFEPFFTTKEMGKGTGLGLSQVYGFIMQSGGDITIESTLGEGCVISMYLPAHESDDAAGYAAPDTSAEKVLIVEDEPDLLDVAAGLFRAIGYEVVTASSSAEAIDLLARIGDIDILFSDVVMPHGMNGVELACLARQRYPTLKIMLVSGYPLPALKAEHGDLENFPFLHKPYQLAELARKLRLMV
ncbi:MAG TPA: PAS domain S-box protein [Herbaspirillum sp.]|jgi:PAS domain S-box-containing protein|nr:PAS domain S-box protein [Herbaspirillum sp.]